eukprot:GHVU01132956.1.p1 GENE.GHVU01132956.1~~GHVU01132956.1.p1  ORF type:complete len:470 (+),score=51.20 GHVU01132956.1:601-2010(+)
MCAAGCCLGASAFFALLQGIYVYFSASATRYKRLQRWLIGSSKDRAEIDAEKDSDPASDCEGEDDQLITVGDEEDTESARDRDGDDDQLRTVGDEEDSESARDREGDDDQLITVEDLLGVRSKRTLMPKALAELRWSARADAARALVEGYTDIKQCLYDIYDDEAVPAEYRCQAGGYADELSKLENGIMAVLWNVLLRTVDATNKRLQSQRLSFNVAVRLYSSLLAFVRKQRDKFELYESAGTQLSGSTEYSASARRARRYNRQLNPLGYGDAPAVELTPREHFRTGTFIYIIDSICRCFQTRLEAYDQLAKLWGFLSTMPSLSEGALRSATTRLTTFYSDDFDEGFLHELVQFQEYVKTCVHLKEDECSIEKFMYCLIVDDKLEQVFPNVTTCLRIFLTLMSSNCSSERCFSKMNRVKNMHRTTMGQERLNDLVIMSMEADILGQIDFAETIRNFASRKARRVGLSVS